MGASHAKPKARGESKSISIKSRRAGLSIMTPDIIPPDTSHTRSLISVSLPQQHFFHFGKYFDYCCQALRCVPCHSGRVCIDKFVRKQYKQSTL